MSVAANVKCFWKSVFDRQEPARRAMTEAVTQAREDLEAATARLDQIVSDRMSETIGEMLDENDRVRGRGKRNAKRT